MISLLNEWNRLLQSRRRCARNVFSILTVAALTIRIVAEAGAQPAPPGFDEPSRGATAPDPLVTSRSRWDANHDGVNTCEEWKFYLGHIFDLADRNHDHVLDATEFAQLGRIESLFAKADFGYFDANGDKKVSRKEFVEQPSPFFARFDKNSDCRVTAEEIENQGKSPRNRRPPPGGGGGGFSGGGPGKNEGW